MNADKVGILRAQDLAELPRTGEIRQRILRLEIQRHMPPARRLDAPDKPSALRDDDALARQRAHEVADDTFNAALLQRGKKMNDFHFLIVPSIAKECDQVPSTNS